MSHKLFAECDIITYVSGISLTVYLCIVDSGQALPPLSSRPAVADWRQFPLFFGTTVYCFEAISLVSLFRWPLQC